MRVFLLMILICFGLQAKNATISIPTMHCPLCTTTVKKAIVSLDGVEKVKVRLNTKEANVIYDENIVSIDTILEAISETTYEPILKSNN